MHCEQANLRVGFGWLVGFPRPLFIPPGARFKNNQTGPFLARVVCVCVLFSRSLTGVDPKSGYPKENAARKGCPLLGKVLQPGPLAQTFQTVRFLGET